MRSWVRRPSRSSIDLHSTSVVITSPAQTGSPQTNSCPPWTIAAKFMPFVEMVGSLGVTAILLALVLARWRPLGTALGPVRTALVPVDHVVANGDPTGCGDVWGATYFSRLIAGDKIADALQAAHRAASRNVEHRGATGLANFLRGELSLR